MYPSGPEVRPFHQTDTANVETAGENTETKRRPFGEYRRPFGEYRRPFGEYRRLFGHYSRSFWKLAASVWTAVWPFLSIYIALYDHNDFTMVLYFEILISGN